MTNNAAPKQLHVVLGNPHSDIGKGWLASSLGFQLGLETVMIKIDPMLSLKFPSHVGVRLDHAIVTDDAATYIKRGLKFTHLQNIVIGKWMHQQLGQFGHVPKVTYIDLAYSLADHICALLGAHHGVIEIGGCSDDGEVGLPSSMVRALQQYGYDVRLHLISLYDFIPTANGAYDIRPRTAVRAIEETMQHYWGLSLKNLSVYVRRENVPANVPDQTLIKVAHEIAGYTYLSSGQVRYIPNLTSPEELDQYITI